MPLSPEAFVSRWTASRGHEDRNDRHFFIEFCDLLGVDRPDPSAERQPDHCFQKPVRIVYRDGYETVRKIDYYKRGSFVIEAKQGSNPGDRDLGSGRRGTQGWRQMMAAAFVQAREYAINLPVPERPPFVITCDIGHVFEIWQGFSGSYGGYGARETIPFAALVEPEKQAFFRTIFVEPQALNPALHAAKVTRQVAEDLAALAKQLEPLHGAERTSAFLMRCIFTMFAEDVDLIERKLFESALRNTWIPDPESFPAGVVALWTAMDKGAHFGPKRLLRFNGGLFTSTEALPLTAPQLEKLLVAAERDWSSVEPTIFGTLVERALEDADRERLGAHFTPREYIERLVRPTVLSPVRADWDIALGQAQQMLAVASADSAGNPREPTRTEREAAANVIREFHASLCRLRVLDPACGSGNFLYVSFALLKELEEEVVHEIADISDASLRLELESVSVNPSQFLGIELNPRAREIADLVLWIGYLQWHRKARGNMPPVEPVLREYKNIQHEDAVLACDAKVEKRDAQGHPLTVWNMRTYVKSTVTGELVPSEAPEARAPLYEYVNPRAVAWPDADFIVSNPPFCGNKHMRKALGDSYTEALRGAYNQVPKTSDLVMYWWEKAAVLVRAGKVRRFGLITTNSITQKFNRGVVEMHVGAKKDDPLAIAFAIPDHPWVVSGAAVRIAMTVGARASDMKRSPVIATVASEERGDDVESVAQRVKVTPQDVVTIRSDLTGGANVVGATRLRANQGLSFQGMNLVGKGFRVSESDLVALGYTVSSLPPVVKPYMNARDLTQSGNERWVIDLYGLTADEVRVRYPALYQRVVDHVKRERDHNKRDSRRKNWWIFGEPVGKLRAAWKGLSRYILSPETAKHRFFVFAPMDLLPDHKLYAVTCDDALLLGVLSSRLHAVWALAAGGTLEDRPTWTNTTCFEPFPFPAPTEALANRIRDLAERLDAHRRGVLTGGFLASREPEPVLAVADVAASPEVTLTGMYNALARLREAEAGGAALDYAERAFHERALVGVLKSLHDDLDAAVAEAYGWPVDLTDDEILCRLVELNATRAADEKAGIVRYLRPSLQNPTGATLTPVATQIGLIPDADTEEEMITLEWPKTVQGQLMLVRDLLASRVHAWTAGEVARAFSGALIRTVERHLGTLEGLGVIRSYGEGKARRWSTTAA